MASDNTLRYIKIDFDTHRTAILQRIRSRWPTIWNDFLANSFGMVLVDIMAWSSATLAFTINKLAGENYISTMLLRESAVRIGSLTGYSLSGPQPSVVYAEAQLASPAVADVTISKGILIRSSDVNSLPFEVSTDYTISAGQTTPITPVLTLQSGSSGSRAISTDVVVTNGSVYVDCIDTTVDLKSYVLPGQSFKITGGTTVYTIQDISAAPGAISNNRITLTTPYEDVSEETSAEVFDKRISLVQGQTITEQFLSPGVESPSYEISLSRVPVIDNTITVTVNGESYTQVTSISTSGADDRVFQAKTFSSGITDIIFGDGSFGVLLPTDAVIVVTYRIGGGISGNVPVNSFNTSIAGIISSLSSPVTVTITNITSSGTGGTDSETLEEARVSIPLYTRTNDRAVTLEDYRFFSSHFTSPQYGTVAYAQPFLRTQNSLLEGNIIFVYAWTTGAAGALVPLSAQLKSALQDYLRTKSVGTDYVIVGDGTQRPVPVSLRFKTFGGYDVSTTKSLVTDTISSMIALLRPGQTVIQSDLMENVKTVLGVDTVNMATPINDIVADNPTELFINPTETYVYNISRTSVSGNLYTAQMPVTPIQVWSFRMYIGTTELTVIPDTAPGYARLIADGILHPTLKSTVNLLSGVITLNLIGSQSDLTMTLIPVTGYSTERPLDVFVGFTGTNTQAVRREIRANLRTWSEGIRVGEPVYATEIAGVTNSVSCIKNVVEAVTGVTAVTRVALGFPSSTDDRINANPEELLKLSSISLNSNLD